MRTSYSALDTFRQCQQKFKFQVIDKIKAPKTVEVVFGTAVHDALKFMFSRNPLFPALNEIIEKFAETWGALSKKVYPELSDAHRQTYEESGAAMLKKFYKDNPPWNYSVVDTESRFEVLLPDQESQKTHIIAGIIDRIDKIGDGEYEIIDYKTNRKIPSQESVNQNLQLSLYHMAILRRWPHLEPAKIKLSLYFLKHGEKLSSSRNQSALSETIESVLETIRTIENSEMQNRFPAQPSVLCSFCQYKQICPAWKYLYKKDTHAPDKAQLQQALNEYFAIKEDDTKNDARIKELQGIIRSYMDIHGVERVFDDRGYFIAKRLQQRFSYNFDAIKGILLGAGLQEIWNSILEADEKKLKLVINRIPINIRRQIEAQRVLKKEFSTLIASSKPIKKSL